MKRPEIVWQIKEILRRVAPTAEVIVFGSEARGDARQHQPHRLVEEAMA